jgi:hypothetical protein
MFKKGNLSLSWQYETIIVHALEFTKWATWTKFQHLQLCRRSHMQHGVKYVLS